ncbi:MAG: RNA recognition motif domain-containing protein [Verrucomicrobiota bacterium]
MSSDYPRRRRQGGRRHHHHHRHDGGGRRFRSAEPKQQSGGIIGFFKRLFGLEKPVEYDRPPRRQREGRREERAPMFGGEEQQSQPYHRREEAPVEVTSPKLYVGNLSYETSESDLFDLFAQAGAVHNVEIVRDRHSNSKGFGFVEMQAIETAKAAVDQFNGKEFMGRQIVVNGAKS